MARPTDDPKHFRIDLRVNEETRNNLIAITQQKGQTIAEYVRGLISNNDFGLTDTETKLLKDIFSMAKLSGVSQEEFLRILDEEMTNGNWILNNGKIKSERK